MAKQEDKPDRKETLRKTRKLLQSMGMPADDTPDGIHADIWEAEERLRKLEQVRARQLAAAFKGGKG